MLFLFKIDRIPSFFCLNLYGFNLYGFNLHGLRLGILRN
ncbi:hypothetical protein AO368_0915 [Moraxella catarrhalis]|nr:hypothetical protein AO368_0915 [Moraxella catarrhalis]